MYSSLKWAHPWKFSVVPLDLFILDALHDGTVILFPKSFILVYVLYILLPFSSFFQVNLYLVYFVVVLGERKKKKKSKLPFPYLISFWKCFSKKCTFAYLLLSSVKFLIYFANYPFFRNYLIHRYLSRHHLFKDW